MRKVLDYDKNIKNKNEYDKIEIHFKKLRPRKININYENYYYNNNKNKFQNNSIINNNKKEYNILFKANKIQEKIFELKKQFSIFPKINKKKNDKNISLKNSINNNNISSEIKDKFIENKFELNKDEEKNNENDKSFFSNESIKKFSKIFIHRKSKSIDMKNFVDDDDNKNILLTLDINDLI